MVAIFPPIYSISSDDISNGVLLFNTVRKPLVIEEYAISQYNMMEKGHYHLMILLLCHIQPCCHIE